MIFYAYTYKIYAQLVFSDFNKITQYWLHRSLVTTLEACTKNSDFYSKPASYKKNKTHKTNCLKDHFILWVEASLVTIRIVIVEI